jgi:anti-sigma-K factor RskA
MTMHSEHEHVDDLIEGYALGALEPSERNLVDQHRPVCPPCDKQVRSAEDTAHMLGFLATPVAPPSYCKSKLLEKIEREDFLRRPTRRSRVPSSLTAWTTVAALTLFMMTGAWSMSLQRQLSRMSGEMTRARNEIAALQDTLAEVQAIRPLKGEGQSQYVAGNTFMKPGSKKALVVIRDLPPLQPGQTYQLWVAREGLQEPLVTFNPLPSDHTTQVEITPSEPMDSYKWIMVTVEHAGGGKQPSTQRVLFGDL